MSTVKSKNLQVGTDATATNNFTIYQPATPDGTLRIGVGNADSPTEVAGFNATGLTGDGSQLTNLPSKITLGTKVDTTSGTAVDFTSIPSGVKRITISFQGVSTNSTSYKQIQLGTGGSPTTSGYLAFSTVVTSGPAGTLYTTGFGIRALAAADVLEGSITFTLLDSSTNTWVGSGSLGNSNVSRPYSYITNGSVNLSGTLDMVRLTTGNGTNTFDAGSINIMYE